MNNTSEILVELEAILQANPLLEHVGVSVAVTALPQETAKTAAYISLVNSVPKPKGTSPEIDNYDFSGFIAITINAECTDDKYLINYLVDSVQRSILQDGAMWLKIVDRDILSVEYDNAEFFPKRSAIVALEVTYRLTCN